MVWCYDDERDPKEIFLVIRPWKKTTLPSLDREFQRRHNHITEVVLPNMQKQFQILGKRVDKLQNYYEKAPELVVGNDRELEIRIVGERPVMRVAEEVATEAKEKAEIKEATSKIEGDVGRLLAPVFDYLKRLDIRVKAIESMKDKDEYYTKNLQHHQEQIIRLFQHLKLDIAAPKEKLAAKEKELKEREEVLKVKEEELKTKFIKASEGSSA